MTLAKEPAINLTPEEWLPYEELIQRFEQAWEDGNRPALADYLPPGGDWPWAALVELAHADLEFRLKAGEAARVEEYWQLYPALTEHAETAVDLILAEYEVRRRNESALGREEYLTRFPQYESELRRAWETRILAAPVTHSLVNRGSVDEKPAHLGKYELLEVVGRGAFGVVYRARDTALDRTVAIKVPRLDSLSFPEEADRFLREARSAAQLQHPHIVTLYEVCRTDHTAYLVYEFVKGTTLAEHLTAARLLPVQSAELLAQLAEALDYAHRQGVVHRDLKPANILLDAAGQPHVMDFGLAKRDAGEKTLTVEGEVLGTPAYMSPEQARGDAHSVDARSDVYSLGVIFYELLAGDLPFCGNSRMLLKQVLEDDPRDPRRLNDQIPRDLETICLKCLRKEPRERYPSAGALAKDLRRFLAGEPIDARPVGAWMRGVKWVKRRPALAGLLAVSVVAMVVLGVGGLWTAARERGHAQEADQQALTARRYQYAAEVSLAYEAWYKARVVQVRDLLQRQIPSPGQPDLRDFAWYYLWRLSHRDLLLAGHAGPIGAVAFSPDGRILASSSQDKTVKLWDAGTWKECGVLRGHDKPVYCLAFSPDGTLLATGSYDNTVTLWEVTTRLERATISTHLGAVFSVAFSPNGKTLAYSPGLNGLVKLWDVAANKEKAILQAGHPQNGSASGLVTGLTFAPDGKTLAGGSWADCTVKLWDLATGQIRANLEGHTDAPNELAFSPDGKTLASASGDKTIRLWDAASGALLKTLQGHSAGTRAVAFSPDGKTLVSAGWDETVQVWDLATDKVRATLKGHTGRVHAVAFAPDGATLATAGDDKTIRLWDPRTGRARPAHPEAMATHRNAALPEPTSVAEEPFNLHPHLDPVFSLAFAPDGKRLAIGTNTTAIVWDLISGRELLTLREGTRKVWGSAFLPNGHILVTASQDKLVKVWDTRSGHALATMRGHQHEVYGMALSPNGQTLVTVGGRPGEPGEVKLWDLATNTERAQLQGHTDIVRSASFSPDGKLLATGAGDETVKLWDVATGRERATFRGHHGTVYVAAFAPDGQTLATGGADLTIKLWDLATGAVRATLPGHISPIYSLAFSPDAKTLTSGSQDGTVMLWDPITGRDLATLKGHSDRVTCLAFSPDGKTLASGGFDHKVFLWQAAREEEVDASGH